MKRKEEEDKIVKKLKDERDELKKRLNEEVEEIKKKKLFPPTLVEDKNNTKGITTILV